ncbi:MAG: hypothetical protein ABI654_14525, partial [Betaproteobacteria bacterium]
MTRAENARQTKLPLYRTSIDWAAFYDEYPLPDVFQDTVYLWSRDRIRALQNERFLNVIATGWKNPFYRARWSAAGLQPGDIRSIDDIVKLPTFNSDDVKDDLQRDPPFG